MLSHIDKNNNPTMVNVSDKNITKRSATARVSIILPKNIMTLLDENNELNLKKGPVFQTAIIAGTMGVKKTSDIIPFCHPLNLEGIKFKVDKSSDKRINIFCTVNLTGKTGVEMEALTGCMSAALTVYDMCKAMGHDIKITDCELVEKTGGKSDIKRPESQRADQCN
ncbi:MAG: cyclic pyranopterin monophosphate synthase MoaC [Bacteriovoracaceae bacterium]|jgi:cyclic pyranopterin phosphate synthase|nr:cyclic pyranopterin monophosphate synthase MoaC [Bacteriovoracaceae bacterium]